MKKTQQGFTLVEMVIAMVIVGLLLGSVLKGQQLLVEAKVKSLEANFNSVAQAIYTYQERYHALPGDDANANRFGLNISGGDGNGQIDGDYSSGTQESGLAWQHLRAARLVMGTPDDLMGPINAFGGKVGIGMDSTLMPWVFIGFTNIPDQIGLLFEERLDGSTSSSPPDPQGGQVRAERGGILLTGNYKNDQELLNLLFAL